MTRAWLLAVLLLAVPARADMDLGDADGGGEDAPLPAHLADSYAAFAVGDASLTESLKAMYALDYAEAERLSDGFRTRLPENPYGELFLAGQLWWRSATENLTADDDPALAARFDRHSRAAVAKAKRLFKAPKDRVRAEAYFVAGMSLGVRGQWRLTNGQYFKAYLDGKKAIKYLKKCVDIDPDFHDAYLGLGIFDYQAAVLPGVLRLGALLLARGDRERGLERIQRAIDKGQFANRQAASFLLTIYQTTEKDPAKALALTRRMRADFPEAVYYHGVEGAMAASNGDMTAALASWTAAYAALAGDPAALRRKFWGVLCGSWGADCVSEGRLVAAEAWTTWALNTANPGAPAGWTSALHLVRGFARDARRNMKDARDDYQAVLSDPTAPAPLKDLAGQCARQWCSPARLISLRRS